MNDVYGAVVQRRGKRYRAAAQLQRNGQGKGSNVVHARIGGRGATSGRQTRRGKGDKIGRRIYGLRGAEGFAGWKTGRERGRVSRVRRVGAARGARARCPGPAIVAAQGRRHRKNSRREGPAPRRGGRANVGCRGAVRDQSPGGQRRGWHHGGTVRRGGGRRRSGRARPPRASRRRPCTNETIRLGWPRALRRRRLRGPAAGPGPASGGWRAGRGRPAWRKRAAARAGSARRGGLTAGRRWLQEVGGERRGGGVLRHSWARGRQRRALAAGLPILPAAAALRSSRPAHRRGWRPWRARTGGCR